MKICRKCLKRKTNSEFSRATRNKDGLQSYCITCSRVAAAKSNAKKKRQIATDAARKLLVDRPTIISQPANQISIPLKLKESKIQQRAPFVFGDHVIEKQTEKSFVVNRISVNNTINVISVDDYKISIRDASDFLLKSVFDKFKVSDIVKYKGDNPSYSGVFIVNKILNKGFSDERLDLYSPVEKIFRTANYCDLELISKGPK